MLGERNGLPSEINAEGIAAAQTFQSQFRLQFEISNSFPFPFAPVWRSPAPNLFAIKRKP